MATTTSNLFPLATEDPNYGSSTRSGDGGVAAGDAEGSSGSSSSFNISKGGLAAIIVVVALVAIIGATTGALFLVAKQREWTMKETIRRSARKVVQVLTPRRTEFPKSVKDSLSSPSASTISSRRFGRTRTNDVPPTPRLKPEDIEKGMGVGPYEQEIKRKLSDKRQKKHTLGRKGSTG